LVQLWLISPAQAWAQLRVQKVSAAAAAFAYTGNGYSPAQRQANNSQLKIQTSPSFILDLKLQDPKAAVKAYGQPVAARARPSTPVNAAVPATTKPAEMAAALAAAYQQALPILDELSPEKAPAQSSEESSGSARKLMDALLGRRSWEDSGSVRAAAPPDAKTFLRSGNTKAVVRFASPPAPEKPGRLKRLLVAAPLLTLALMSLNSAAYAAELGMHDKFQHLLFLYKWSLTPAHILAALKSLDPAALVQQYLTFFSSIFMHVNVEHLLGNMLGLLAFGPFIEKSLGRAKAVCLYLLSGLLAGLGSFLLAINDEAPHLGASGAIAGLAGAMIILNARYFTLTTLRAVWDDLQQGRIQDRIKTLWHWLLGAGWFGLAAYTLLEIPDAIQQFLGQAPDHIDHIAHIGGFLSGAVLFWLLRARPIKPSAK
jgi:membrane associated rhomboid family serine protease